MEGFGLLVGHMVGDYVLQNDWMAANKTNPHPGPKPPSEVPQPKTGSFIVDVVGHTSQIIANVKEWGEWHDRRDVWRRGHLACAIHCTLYTFAVWACSFWWMPWWGLVLCWLIHFPIDRFRLANWWMNNVSGQQAFAARMTPWSIIVVDNTAHLLTLFLIQVAVRMCKA